MVLTSSLGPELLNLLNLNSFVIFVCVVIVYQLGCCGGFFVNFCFLCFRKCPFLFDFQCGLGVLRWEARHHTGTPPLLHASSNLGSFLHLTDDSGTEVDADVFEELLQAGNLTVRVTTEKSTGKTQPC